MSKQNIIKKRKKKKQIFFKEAQNLMLHWRDENNILTANAIHNI